MPAKHGLHYHLTGWVYDVQAVIHVGSACKVPFHPARLKRFMLARYGPIVVGLTPKLLSFLPLSLRDSFIRLLLRAINSCPAVVLFPMPMPMVIPS